MSEPANPAVLPGSSSTSAPTPVSGEVPTAILADDEPLLAQALAMMLARAWPELAIQRVVHDGIAALDAIVQLRPDIAFLDIRMPGATGIEVAARLAADDNAPRVVFVTAYDQYAIEAFDAEAVDYLLKPVEPARLERCVTRLRAKMLQTQIQAPNRAPNQGSPSALDAPAVVSALDGLRRLVERLAPSAALLQAGATIAASASATRTPLPVARDAVAAPPLRFLRASLGDVTRQIPVERILYLEAQDKYVSVVTADASALVRTPLSELASALDASRFSRIHRSMVVNVDAIESIRRDETGRMWVHLRERVQGREARLPVGRQYAAQFKGM